MNEHCSLTAPHDVQEHSVAIGSHEGFRDLTNEESKIAVSELVDSDLTQKFPRQDKFYADPIYNNQIYCLHSFIPSKGAKPDDQGLFGFMKCRGTFFTTEEANQRAEWIIRNADSYHNIQTAYTGRPFPIAANFKKYVQETHEVDIRKKTVQTVSEDIRQKKLDEKKEMDDIKEREKNLLEESKDDYVPDPIERYTTLRVKKANLVWTYIKTQKKMDEMKESILRTRREIDEMDQEDSSYMEDYYEKYLQARKDAGIPDEDDSFIKYMVEDVDLGF